MNPLNIKETFYRMRSIGIKEISLSKEDYIDLCLTFGVVFDKPNMNDDIYSYDSITHFFGIKIKVLEDLC